MWRYYILFPYVIGQTHESAPTRGMKVAKDEAIVVERRR